MTFVCRLKVEIPAFYKMMINSQLISLRDLYRKEMAVKQDDFIFETIKQNRNFFSVIKQEARPKKHKIKTNNKYLQNIAGDAFYEANVEKYVSPQSL